MGGRLGLNASVDRIRWRVTRQFFQIGLCLILFITARSLPAQELSESAARILEDIKYLSDDEREGRGIKTEGLNAAADYIAESFKASGLDVTAVDGGPFQKFTISDGSLMGPGNALTLAGPDGQKLSLKLDSEFVPCAFGAAGEVDAPIVFVGYGIDSPEAAYSDFAGIDLNGKIALVMRRTPLQGDPHGPFSVGRGISRHAALTTKLSQAFTHGAAAVIFVNDPYEERQQQESLQEAVDKAQANLEAIAEKIVAPEADLPELMKQLQHALEQLRQTRLALSEHQADKLMPFGYGGSRSGKSIPCFQITQKVADTILKSATGHTLAELEAQIDETRKPVSQLLTGWSAKGVADVKSNDVPVMNVIGVLPGEGPLQEETIVIGAHYDHLGRGEVGSLAQGSTAIHNGADDNASGTAGLLELARRLAARETPLPRRLVFVAFTGEERGLLGAEHYVANPVFPLDSMIAMFNMDMIGRLQEQKLIVFGTGTSSLWAKLVDQAASDWKLSLNKKPEGLGPSDHSVFYSKKIPVLHAFTGLHGEYHTPADDWEKINASGEATVISFLEQIIIATAQSDVRPNYIHVPGMAAIDRMGSRPYFGSIPDFSGMAEGYAIQGVAPESPAEKAGLKAGDVIVKIGESSIGGLDDFDLVLRKHQAGQQIQVTILRDGQHLTVPVILSSPR